MEGINKQIFELIAHDILELNPDCQDLTNKIKEFLTLDEREIEKRQRLAIEISKYLLQRHSKMDIPENLTGALAELELSIKDIQPSQRDHVCHSLTTFLLGFCIIKKLNLDQVSIFEWKLTGLLHDVGYPLEIADNIARDFLKDYEVSMLNEQASDYSPFITNNLSRYLPLYDKTVDKNKNNIQGRNALALIGLHLRKWGISIDVQNIFSKMSQGENFDEGLKRSDHGIASAILVLKAIDKKYELNNPQQTPRTIHIGNSDWNFKYMEKNITNACSAIFVHNLKLNNVTFNFKKAELATLLKVCDELQDWDRPKGEKMECSSPQDYKIEFKADRIVFCVKKGKKKKLEDNLKMVINFPLDISEV